MSKPVEKIIRGHGHSGQKSGLTSTSTRHDYNAGHLNGGEKTLERLGILYGHRSRLNVSGHRPRRANKKEEGKAQFPELADVIRLMWSFNQFSDSKTV